MPIKTLGSGLKVRVGRGREAGNRTNFWPNDRTCKSDWKF